MVHAAILFHISVLFHSILPNLADQNQEKILHFVCPNSEKYDLSNLCHNKSTTPRRIQAIMSYFELYI